MNRCPKESDHTLIKRRLMDGKVVGVQEDEVERVEVIICPTCRTTLGRPCEDAKHVDSGGHPLCGVASAGVFLVDSISHSDCPLCHTIVARTGAN